MSNLKDKIEARTPQSVTVTDNPIFRIKETVNIEFNGVMMPIEAGTEVRILGCRLNDKGFTHIRYMGSNFIIDNNNLEYVEGDLGEQVN